MHHFSRRSLLKTTAAGLTLTATTTTATTATATPTGDPATDGVPMFLYNAANTGVTDASGPTETPAELWTVTIGTGVYSPPAIGETFCYSTTVDGRLVTVERRTGEEFWEFDAGDALLTTPALGEERVYLANENRDIYALDRRTGTVEWRIEDFVQGNGATAPVLANGLVHVGGSNGVVHAFDAETGRPHWRIQFPGALLSSFAVRGNNLYAATDRAVYALDASRVEESEREDQRSAGDDEDSSGATDGSLAEPVARERSWGKRLDAQVRASPAVRNEQVVVGTDEGVTALDATEGTVEWTTRGTETIRGSPAVTGDRVYAGTADGEVVAYTTKGGFEQWRQQVGRRIDTPVIVADGTLYAASTDGVVAALSPSDGTIQWEIQRDHVAPTAPHAVDDRLYLADWDGTLSALLSAN